MFVAFGLLGAEAWPLTGWKLFSRVREDTQAGWQVMTVAGDGRERQLDFAGLGRGYRGAHHVAAGFPGLDLRERDSVCITWAKAAAARGPVHQVVVYRVVRRVEPGGRVSAVRRSEEHRCRP